MERTSEVFEANKRRVRRDVPDHGEHDQRGKNELEKEAIKRGNMTLEQIAETLKLPLAFVQELALQKGA